MSFSTTLIWTPEGSLVSRKFGDVYFSSEGGFEESRHVFVSGNRLRERWAGRHAPFRIAELGFGTGLNLLATWDELGAGGPPIEYFAIEADPLDVETIRRALSPWTVLGGKLEELLAGYPDALGGRELVLAGGRLCFTLLIGDAAARIADLPAGIDAWYFDGFSPSKNPAMWTAAIFREAFARSAPGATFATFSSAAAVRAALDAAGFEVEKSPGFGRKREMIRGRRPPEGERPARAPWYRSARPALSSRPSALVAGAGLAGAAAAAALAERGFRVTVIERAPGPATGASGNPAALVVPVPGLESDPVTRLSSAAFPVFERRLRSLEDRGLEVARRFSGALLLARDERAAGRIRKGIPGAAGFELLGGAGEASRLAGTAVSEDVRAAAFVAGAGWIDPRDLCRALLGSADAIQVRYGVEGARLAREGSGWALLDRSGSPLARADVAIAANAGGCLGLLEALGLEALLPLAAVRGQVSLLPETAESARLALPVSFDGFVSPRLSGAEHVLGATHDRHLLDPEPRLEQHLGLIASLERTLPDLARSWRGAPLRGRVGFRAALPDALPAVGPVPDPAAAAFVPGLYLSVGHGWRGVLYSLLAAEVLAGEIAGPAVGAPAIARELVDALHPARFLVRALRRGSHASIGAAASRAADLRPGAESSSISARA